MRFQSQRRKQSVSASPRSQVEGLEQRVLLTTVNITGSTLWTDQANGKHAVPLCSVELRKVGASAADAPLAVGTTDVAGNFTIPLTFDPADGDFGVFARTYARNAAVDVRPDTGASAKTWSMDSTGAVVKATTTAPVAIPAKVGSNSVDSDKAFGITGAALEAATYAATLATPLAKMPSQIVARYPEDIVASGVDNSFFSPSKKEFFITQTQINDWDTIQHEYGHYVQAVYKFVNSPSADHGFGSATPKPGGDRLAWSEGWATFFGIEAQLKINAPYGQGVPQVGDAKYVSANGATSDFSLDGGAGERDEESVGRALYHMVTGDEGFSINDKVLFQRNVGDADKTFGQAWLSVAKTLGGRDRAELGQVLANQKIAPLITGPKDEASLATNPITWDKNGNNSFKVQFFNEDFSKLLFTTAELGNVASYTPSAADLRTIFAGKGPVKYVVEGKDTTADETPGTITDPLYAGPLDRYWSQAQSSLAPPSVALVLDTTGSMSQEIGGAIAAMTQYVSDLQATLRPGDTPPTVELITFDDSPHLVISSNDLDAVKAALGSQHASGGGDCPEGSGAALVQAGEDVAAGGSILMITDASSLPGPDISSAIASLRGKGIEVDAVISGDCSDDGEVGRTAAAALDEGSCNGDGDCCADGEDADVIAANVSKQKLLTDEAAAALRLALASVAAVTPKGAGFGTEPPQVPIDDAGQKPVDDHANILALATPIVVNGQTVSGVVGNSVQSADGGADVADAVDVFTFHLKAGVAYNIVTATDGYQYASLTLRDKDGNVLQTGVTGVSDAGFGLDTRHFTPDVEGDYYLSVGQSSGGAAGYVVRATDNPVVGEFSSVKLFSTAAADTGGTFLFMPEAKSGGDALVAYQNAILNVLSSTFRPTVLNSQPQKAPLGTTLDLQLSGSKTNWKQGLTTVAFSGAGITVNATTVLSPTKLVVNATIDPSAALTYRDATVKTTLGAKTETAVGKGVVQIAAAITSPTLLQVSPSQLTRGGETVLTIVGVKTAWDGASTLSFGPGVTVKSLSVVSATKIIATVSVSASAEVGFRVATIETTGKPDDVQHRAVFVNAVAIASIASVASISPAQGDPGAKLDVSIVGNNTHFAKGVTIASFGDGITASSVDVADATHATAHVRIAAAAATGFRNVTLTTGSENAVLLDGFFVTSGTATPAGATLSISDVSRNEGNGGQTAYTFTVSLSKPSTRAVKVHYATADGTAAATDKDYSGVSGDVTFAPNQTSKSVTVYVNGDKAFEPNQTFKVNLSKATNATIAKATGTGTIVNDDSLRIAALYLINTKTGQRIATLTEGVKIDLKKLGASYLSIEAVADPATVGSVDFNLDGRHVRHENVRPYALFANLGDKFFPGKLMVGGHTLKVTPRTLANGAGFAGTTRTVHFTLFDPVSSPRGTSTGIGDDDFPAFADDSLLS